MAYAVWGHRCGRTPKALFPDGTRLGRMIRSNRMQFTRRRWCHTGPGQFLPRVRSQTSVKTASPSSTGRSSSTRRMTLARCADDGRVQWERESNRSRQGSSSQTIRRSSSTVPSTIAGSPLAASIDSRRATTVLQSEPRRRVPHSVRTARDIAMKVRKIGRASSRRRYGRLGGAFADRPRN